MPLNFRDQTGKRVYMSHTGHQRTITRGSEWDIEIVYAEHLGYFAFKFYRHVLALTSTNGLLFELS